MLEPILGQLETPEKPKYATNRTDKGALAVWSSAYTTALAMGRTRKECISIANDAVDDYHEEFD